MTPAMLSFKYLGPKPPLKGKMKLCPCAHEGAAATHSVEKFCALGEDNAADPFYSFQVSDLPPHLILNAHLLPSYPFISWRPRGSLIRNIYLLIHLYPGHMQGSLLNSRNRGTLDHTSNAASRGNKLLASLSSITVQQPGKEVRDGWAVLSQLLLCPIPLAPLPLSTKPS